MLLEKWTNGDLHPTHQRLRALSGDRHGGSNLDDLKNAYRQLGINLKFSPNGGERITFSGLLRRLAHGAGAVVLGDDSKLPRWYGRWDYGFWKMTKKEKKKHPSHDNHAVYVERYDRAARPRVADGPARARATGTASGSASGRCASSPGAAAVPSSPP